MTKIEKACTTLKDEFCSSLDKAFHERFSRAVTTEYNIIGMNLVTTTDDEKPLSDEESLWIGAFSLGYNAALAVLEKSE